MTAEESMPTTRQCGTMVVHERLLRTDPAYQSARVRSENRAFAARLGRAEARSGVTVIPVVVHVVYKTAAQNISDAQVRSQIDVLNQDFRMRNADVSRIPAPFRGLAADARVEFVLATRDPGGAPTNGITRTQTNVDTFTDDNGVKSATTGGADAWPADRYLNLWSCQLGGGLLGYAQFPGGPAATDGVVILHSAFGTTGTATAPFNLGRTATHEIGHYLNLRHIWGDDGTGCNGDDFVGDTPNAAGANTGKPAFPHVTCGNGPNGDMFMNYMDYTDDDSMFMFTAGQVTRMQASLDHDRPSLGTTKSGSTGRAPGLTAFNRLYMEWKGITGDQGIYWSGFDGSSWAAQQRVSGVGTSVGPALATFNNRVYAAWKGIEGDQGIYWSSSDGTTWAPQQRISGVGTSVGPALATFNGRLYAAWKGIEGDQGIYWSSSDGTTWAPQQRIAGVGTNVGPSLAVLNNRLYAAWKGIQGDQGIYWSSFDGSTWAAQQRISGVGTSVGPSLATFNGRLYAAWKGIEGDQGIYWSSSDGSTWAAQQRIAGVGTSVGPGLAVFNNRLYAAWKGIEGDQGIYWSSSDGRTWAAQQRVPGVGTGPQGREDGSGDRRSDETATATLVGSGAGS